MFTKLGEGNISPSQSSPVFAISAYREIVVYMTASTDSSCTSASGISLVPQFSANSGDGFGATGQSFLLHAGGRLRIDGNEVKLTVSNPGHCTPETAHYIIAGVL